KSNISIFTFKEYCIADLTRHKDNKVALRWRTKNEVVTGKGQFQCGSRKCEERENLRSWEVNFSYREQGDRKNALVKLRLCSLHSDQLNYTSRKREVKHLKRSTERQIKKSKLKMQIDENDLRSDDNTVKKSLPIGTCSKPLDDETHESHGNIWDRKPDVNFETASRENDFERYIEDLLL
ncbi:PREDICTED: protein FRA10AC1-like, partial [Rhagoletis zephyria]|uniref:protein FRA10AC1-like n=1 Tax=Rhagoletis zephyria TaxID=28612 RepID=UPI0008117648